MEVGHRQQFVLASLDPGGFGRALALRAVAVAATVIHVPLITTTLAPLTVAAQGRCTTRRDRADRLALGRLQRMGVREGLAVATEVLVAVKKCATLAAPVGVGRRELRAASGSRRGGIVAA